MFSTQYNKDTKLWTGLDVPSVFNPKISIAQVVLKACEVYGSKIAQVSNIIQKNTGFKAYSVFFLYCAQIFITFGD